MFEFGVRAWLAPLVEETANSRDPTSVGNERLGFDICGVEPLRSEFGTARVGSRGVWVSPACSPPSTNSKTPRRATEKRLRVSA